MKFVHRFSLITIILCCTMLNSMAQQPLISYSELPNDPFRPHNILNQMRKVADWQIKNTGIGGGTWRHEAWDWTNGALYTGIFACGMVTNEAKYLNFLRKMGQELDWQTGPRRFFADDYCVGQTFAQLYALDKKPEYIDKFRKLADSILTAPHDESLDWKNEIRMREWAWCDALFMGPTALAYLSTVTTERKYLDIADRLWWKSTEYLFDKDDHLFYRDQRYFNQKEKNGQKVFWSRGNGWVVGGIVRMLENLPKDYPTRSKYLDLYQKMMLRLAALQQPDGTWHTSLLDPEAFPNREVSGTAFFTYAILRGISEGWLEPNRYFPIVERAWIALNECVQTDGKLGFVQQIGAAPRPVTAEDTEVYGVGAFLLAGAELYKLTTEKPYLIPNKANRNLLGNALRNKNLDEILRGVSTWRKTKKQTVDNDFQALPMPVKTALVAQAEKFLNYNYPQLTAWQYLQYKQTGDRRLYDEPVLQRLEAVKTLVIGEVLERKGRFLTDIVNGLWLIAEQSSWVIPAHIGSLQKRADGLPDITEDAVDIYAGEVATLVAWSLFLLEADLEKISTKIPERLRYELDRRIFSAYLNRSDYWWLGYGDRYPPNNWNPWTNNSVLEAAALIEPNPQRLSKIVFKAANSIDQFLNPYGEDGGCDEGPSYWKRAAGETIQFLTTLDDISNGTIRIYDQKPLHDMGRYILKMHISDRYFVNFADCSARTTPYLPPVYLFGKVYNDSALLQFAAYLNTLKNAHSVNFTEGGQNKVFKIEDRLSKFIRYIHFFNDLKNIAPREPRLDFSFMKDIGVMTARSKNGVFVALQGGHNGESHNHNDVGNFIIYADGKPVVVDAGTATYRKETFSKNRYNLWHTQSAWHNCPTINGVMQGGGKNFTASDLIFSNTAQEALFKLDLSKAYPEAAKVSKWQRNFNFNIEKGVLSLEENYALSTVVQPQEIHFLVAQKPILGKKMVDLGVLILDFDPNLFEVKIEEKSLNDTHLEEEWGKSLWRISFVSKLKTPAGRHIFSFSKKEK